MRYSTICMRHLLRGDMEIELSSRSGSLSDSDSLAENTSEDDGEMGARNCGVASSVYRLGTFRPCNQFKLVKLLSGELLFLAPRCCRCTDEGGLALQLKLSMVVACVDSATVATSRTARQRHQTLQPPYCEDFCSSSAARLFGWSS